MRYYSLKKHTNNKTIFGGYYNSFTECLEDAVKKCVDLSYIDLSHSNLSNANLDTAKMPHSNLHCVNLTGANLSESNLNNSNFSNSSLYNCCFSYSNLEKSDFSLADFGSTLINGSNLSQCNFSTLSCFDLDFQSTASMYECKFIINGDTELSMSTPPIIIKGILNTPVIIMDKAIKIGSRILPKTIMPTLIRAAGIYAPVMLNRQSV